ncbi:MAG TPA: phosphoadenosine phosphosulfate reductase family protein, partial [Candidatus Acidoferrum sp.]|nr:phosphoadenosine phosphosulfate reductase family protein [Candidatus Acidoferrum sp.]
MPTAEYIERVENNGAETIVADLVREAAANSVCLTCSFQAEDMIVLDLLRKHLPHVPVVFLETGYHFADTYQFRDRITADWKLNLVNALPRQTVKQQESELGILYTDDPAKCCQLRKVEPLMASLEPFEIWFTGLRREQSPTRKNLKKIEHHRLPSGKTLLK